MSWLGMAFIVKWGILLGKFLLEVSTNGFYNVFI